MSLLHHALTISDLANAKQALTILLSSPALNNETINFRGGFEGETVLSAVASARTRRFHIDTPTEIEEILPTIAAMLLSFGADPDIADGIEYRTPLHYAAHRGNVGMVKKLLENGADVSRLDRRMANPLQAAVKAMEVCKEEQDRPRYREIISILQEAGRRYRSRG
jgi:ankyrin repeat protein